MLRYEDLIKTGSFSDWLTEFVPAAAFEGRKNRQEICVTLAKVTLSIPFFKTKTNKGGESG